MRRDLRRLLIDAVGDGSTTRFNDRPEDWQRFYRFMYALHQTDPEDRPTEHDVSYILIKAMPNRWDLVKDLRAIYMRGTDMMDYLFGQVGADLTMRAIIAAQDGKVIPPIPASDALPSGHGHPPSREASADSARAHRRRGRGQTEPADAREPEREVANAPAFDEQAAIVSHSSVEEEREAVAQLDVAEDDEQFFVPGAVNAGQSEASFADIARSAEQHTGKKVNLSRRIVRIEFEHEGQLQAAQVGRITDYNSEMVFAIMEADAYLICTTTNGALRGIPVIVERDAVRQIEDFPQPVVAAGRS